MNIPNVPKEKLVGDDGDIHPNWRSYFSQMTNVLQAHVPDTGYVLPKQPDETIKMKLSNDSQMKKILYNSDTNKAMLNNQGSYKEISTRFEQLTTAQRIAIPASEITGQWVYDTDLDNLYYGINSTWKEVAFT